MKILRTSAARGGLYGVVLVLLYYWSAAHDERLEWISKPFHARMWNVPGGCLSMEHYLVVDWIVAATLVFIVTALGSLLYRGTVWLLRRLTLIRRGSH